MAEWLIVNGTDIIGRGGVSGAMPTPPDGLAYIDATSALKVEYSSALNDLIAQGRSNDPELYPDVPLIYPQWDGQAVAVPADTRPTFRVVSDKSVIVADGIDYATLTITFVNGQGGSVITALQGAQILRTRARVIAVTFVDGVATFRFSTTESKEIYLYSSPSRAIDGYTVKLLDAVWPEAPAS